MLPLARVDPAACPRAAAADGGDDAAGAARPDARGRAPVRVTEGDGSSLSRHFEAEMDRLGPFEPRPRLAVAVSGGADSLALTLLAREWADRREGTVFALTVDHGIRAEAAAEADRTLRRLAAYGIPGRKLTLRGLSPGPALAERARQARYDALLDACAGENIAHLLLGHHRGDQVETVMLRALAGSDTRGLAGMPALLETRAARLLRPLLDVPGGALRAFLASRGETWIEDPSNRDPAALRARLRTARADPDGDALGTLAVARAARAAGAHRAARDAAVAAILAERATIRPEGFALLTPGPIDPDALAALLRAIAGASYAPPIDAVAALARAPRPATLGGVRIAQAGRLGPGWLLARERRAMREPIAARQHVVWDGRFRLIAGPERPWAGVNLGALGADAARFRGLGGLPTLVLHGLPALRLHESLIAVPHIGQGDRRWQLLFDPRNPAAVAPFLAAHAFSNQVPDA